MDISLNIATGPAISGNNLVNYHRMILKSKIIINKYIYLRYLQKRRPLQVHHRAVMVASRFHSAELSIK